MSMPSDPTLYAARLSDGRSAVSAPVRVRLAETGLEILAEGERRAGLVWPYAELNSAVPLRGDAPDVLLSRKPDGAQALFVADPAFARPLLARAAALAPARQRWHGLRPGIAAVALVAAVAGLVRYFELQPSQAVARHLPQPVREAMGRNVVASLTGHMRRCETPAGRDALDRLTRRLAAAATREPLPLRVVLVDWGLVNAFAAPGGQLIVTRGLVQKAGSPDEVAGVLAHEIGHALELHPESGLVRAMGLAAAAQLVFAGSTGAATNVGLLLTQLRYTRKAEVEADTHALRILQGAGISAKGFGDFFERLQPRPAPRAKADESKPDAGKQKPPLSLARRIFKSELLRTHPLTGTRLAMVRAQPPYPATPSLTEAEWRALREMCGPPPTLAPGGPSGGPLKGPAPRGPTATRTPAPGGPPGPDRGPNTAPPGRAPSSGGG
jgi:Zn-dependent protease with chaperone function